MKIDSKLLHRRIYNALLFTPGKGEAKRSVSGGNVMVTFSDTVTFTSTDGYVAIRSGPADTNPKANRRVIVSGEDLKKLESALRTLEEVVEFEADSNEVAYGYAVAGVFLEVLPGAPLWDKIDTFIDSDYPADPELFQKFAVDPRRLSKFSLLEPKGEYPVDFKLRESNIEQQLLVWRYGPDTRGVFSPLLREAVAEAYDRPEDVLW